MIHHGTCACPSCGGTLRRIGEDVTETLDYVPGRFKVDRLSKGGRTGCALIEAACWAHTRRKFLESVR